MGAKTAAASSRTVSTLDRVPLTMITKSSA